MLRNMYFVPLYVALNINISHLISELLCRYANIGIAIKFSRIVMLQASVCLYFASAIDRLINSY